MKQVLPKNYAGHTKGKMFNIQIIDLMDSSDCNC